MKTRFSVAVASIVVSAWCSMALAENIAYVTCSNRSSFGKHRVEATVGEKSLMLSFKGKTCNMPRISYRPISSKYNGWIRFGADENGCQSIGKAMFGLTERGNPMKIHWLSVSPEVQDGEEGFAQLGYQNDFDPGAGGTVKIYLKCHSNVVPETLD